MGRRTLSTFFFFQTKDNIGHFNVINNNHSTIHAVNMHKNIDNKCLVVAFLFQHNLVGPTASKLHVHHLVVGCGISGGEFNMISSDIFIKYSYITSITRH